MDVILGPVTLESQSHDYSAMMQALEMTEQRNPSIAKLYSIGKSKSGKQLWVLKIGSSDTDKESLPAVRLVAGLNGYEPVATETLIQLAEYLVSLYGKEITVTNIVDKTVIYIAPLLDADSATSFNKDCTLERNGMENTLNRHFDESEAKDKPEISSIENWIRFNPTVLSAAIYGGAEVVAYPFQGSSQKTSVMSKDDENVFIQLSKMYSNCHPTLHQGSFTCMSHTYNFSQGITRASSLHLHQGSYLDFNYADTQSYDLAIYVDCCSYKKPEEMSKIWLDHKKPLLDFISQARKGATGSVKSIDDKPLGEALIAIHGFSRVFTTNADGSYHILLFPGEYVIVVTANGHLPLTKIVHVYPGEATRVDFKLKKDARIVGVPRHSFFIILGSVTLLLLVTFLCVYSTVLYRRRRGYAFHKLNQGQCLFDEDEMHGALSLGPTKGFIKSNEYRDSSSSEDELYNTYAWQNGHNKQKKRLLST